MVNKFIVFYPSYFKLSVIINSKQKSKYIYLLHHFYFFVLIQNFFINFFLNYIVFYQNLNINNFLNFFFFSWEYFFVNQYKVLGKGFKLKKFNNKTIWKYNKSHFKYLFLFTHILQKLKKFFFFVISKTIFLKNWNFFIKNIYKKNCFLKKGIKNLSKEVILKKKKC